MKTTLEQRGYIREQSGKSDKKVTKGTQFLGLRNLEVGTSSNARDRMETVKRRRYNGQQSTLPNRTMEIVKEQIREEVPVQQRISINKISSRVLESVRDSESTDISTDINEAQQNISQNLKNKDSILWNLFQKARHFSDQDPNKKTAFEFLYTQDPDNKEIFEKFGTVLEIQAPKAAKELYVKGLSNDKLFDWAFQHIKFITQREEGCAETSTLKAIFDVNLFDRTAIVQIKEQLKDPSNPIHEYLKKFMEEDATEGNTFLQN